MKLTTVAKVKLMLGMTSTSNDVALNDLVTAVSARIESEMGRSVQTMERTEYRDTILHSRLIELTAWPISSVASVHYDPDGDFADSSLLTQGNEFSLPENGDRGEIQLRIGVGDWPSAIKVVYTGGMAATTNAFIDAYPDVAHAVVEQVSFQWQQRNQIGLDAVSVQGSSISRFAPMKLLPSVKEVIRRHRRGV